MMLFGVGVFIILCMWCVVGIVVNIFFGVLGFLVLMGFNKVGDLYFMLLVFDLWVFEGWELVIGDIFE